VYARDCSDCHGATGEGNGALRFPRLAGQHFSYLRFQITAILSGDRENVSTQHVLILDGIKPEEIEGIAAFLARLGNP
ncbi:MAG: c-type cytochrome, partial [Steroidobacteraceae bacterium]